MRKLTALFVLICFLMVGEHVYGQSKLNKLQKELDLIYYHDQLYRGDSVENKAAKFGWESPEVKVVWKKQQRLDIVNMKKIDSMIAVMGYPGKTLVGDKRKSIAFSVIQHSEFNDQEKYLSLLTAAADAGELNWSSLALLIDRVKTGRGQKQVYGSQMTETSAGIKVYPIEDEAQVNVRRAKIGLGKLEDYLKTFGVNYILPSQGGNPNPSGFYVAMRAETESVVQLIGSQDSLFSKLNYPLAAKSNGIQGKVTLQFTIDPTGVPKDIEVVKSLHPDCDEEAIRVIKTARYVNTAKVDHEIRMNIPFPFKK
jgi:TonB family protein